MNVLIIDDEPLARSIVVEYLQNFPQFHIVLECNDGFEGVKAIQQHHPDLIFLDIQMPKINGFEMLELIDQPPAVIFTTAFDEYALKAFETHAVDYLLKPFGKERFDKAVEKFLDHNQAQIQKKATQALVQTSHELPAQNERIVVKTDGRIKIIPIPDIKFLEAADDYVKVYTAEGAFMKNKTMSFFETVLPKDNFVRVHRSYIVNIREITRIDPYEKENFLAILRTGERVLVSKNGYSKLKEVIGL